MKLNFDCIILGSGVAGMTSAIYLKRAGINCCIIENSAPGGQILKTSIVENYPGTPGVTGPDLAMKMYEQMKGMDICYHYGNVLDIIDQEDYKIVKTDMEELTCQGVILATGRSPRSLELPFEEKWIGRGISYCAICDGPFYREKEVIVLGGGNSALEEALYLATICKKVTIVHRREFFTAQEMLVTKVAAAKNIKTVMNSSTTSYLEKDGHLEGITVKDKETGKTKKIKASGIFLFIGQIPNTNAFQTLGITDPAGYVITNEGRRTEVPFIYGAGDVIAKEVYQIVTATSDGAIAATSYIKDREHK